ncbi:ATP-binding protein [Pedobacter sp. MC2016-15]|uniref:AAA family ATPase n=1 Tax=Pedobacter sp. MC2016-15 TaxID=2994473 RepID=UPI002247CF64|nr:ATP-binding protein [Pedobacter sp. MC2016-15]MCX2478184.1 ATP-binding protein [Pedobacter sp. MC2016-15]
MKAIIGRTAEQAVLLKALNSNEAELIAVFGRRRVGKTYLVREYFHKQMLFDFSGVHNESLQKQLTNFRNTLTYNLKLNILTEVPASWTDAFFQLRNTIEPLITKNKGVIFLDEFPWLNSPRSGFLQAFEFFWNSWASRQKNLIVVICGSAASWMIQNVVRNKNGLHNRITRKIRLLPFNLSETKSYLNHRNINLDEYQIMQLYMAMGGIPQYLKGVEVGKSAAQNIDQMCFTKEGILQTEFTDLYRSLFDEAGKHITIVRALANKPGGLTRKQILDVLGVSTGGRVTSLLDELTESGFISSYLPFKKNVRDTIYKLADEYSRFYLKFMEGNRASGEGTWIKMSSTPSWRSWSGTAFESVCLKHIEQIKVALGINGIQAEPSTWRHVPGKGMAGAQIDLLIDRADFCINICEMKFSTTEFSINKKYADELKSKADVFKQETKTSKTIMMVMITTFGVQNNSYKIGLIQNEVTMSLLFT